METVARLPLTKVPKTHVLEVNYISLDPLSALSGRHLEVAGLMPVYSTRDAWFDFLLGNEREIHVLMAWRGELRVWRGVLEPKELPLEPWGVRWDNFIDPMASPDIIKRFGAPDARPVLRLRTDLREPFHAFADNGNFYFVTVAGQLHTCKRQGEQPRTRVLWGDAQRPIVAVICDEASGRAWAFTSGAGKASPPVWFELVGELRPVAYERTPAMEVKKDDPLPAMLEFARLVVAQKKIQASK
jgi:hypothetical protein